MARHHLALVGLLGLAACDGLRGAHPANGDCLPPNEVVALADFKAFLVKLARSPGADGSEAERTSQASLVRVAQAFGRAGVLEFGFDGYSAALFLSAHPSVTVASLDLGWRPETAARAAMVKQAFPGRFELLATSAHIAALPPHIPTISGQPQLHPEQRAGLVHVHGSALDLASPAELAAARRQVAAEGRYLTYLAADPDVETYLIAQALKVAHSRLLDFGGIVLSGTHRAPAQSALNAFAAAANADQVAYFEVLLDGQPLVPAGVHEHRVFTRKPAKGAEVKPFRIGVGVEVKPTPAMMRACAEPGAEASAASAEAKNEAGPDDAVAMGKESIVFGTPKSELRRLEQQEEERRQAAAAGAQAASGKAVPSAKRKEAVPASDRVKWFGRADEAQKERDARAEW